MCISHYYMTSNCKLKANRNYIPKTDPHSQIFMKIVQLIPNSMKGNYDYRKALDKYKSQ